MRDGHAAPLEPGAAARAGRARRHAGLLGAAGIAARDRPRTGCAVRRAPRVRALRASARSRSSRTSRLLPSGASSTAWLSAPAPAAPTPLSATRRGTTCACALGSIRPDRPPAWRSASAAPARLRRRSSRWSRTARSHSGAACRRCGSGARARGLAGDLGQRGPRGHGVRRPHSGGCRGRGRREADRGEVREGRVALVTDGAASFDTLLVDGLDLFAVGFATSRYASFSEHIASRAATVAVHAPDGMGAPPVRTPAEVLADDAAAIAVAMSDSGDPQARQELFARVLSDVGLPQLERCGPRHAHTPRRHRRCNGDPAGVTRADLVHPRRHADADEAHVALRAAQVRSAEQGRATEAAADASVAGP